MEKGPSSYAEYWTSPENEVQHMKRHTKHMKFQTGIDYSKAATEFANSKKAGNKYFYSSDGSKYLYNSNSNEFMRVSKNGKIITYFPPKAGENYFFSEFSKYGIGDIIEERS